MVWYLTTVTALAGCSGAAASDGDSSAGGAAESAQASGPAIDWARVDSAFGRTGTMQPGDVRRYGMPRGDLRVTAAGVEIKPAFALGSWTAMKVHAGGPVATGDLVLTESELGPVIAKVQEGGIEQTAVLRFWANADAATLARGLRAALDLTKSRDPSR